MLEVLNVTKIYKKSNRKIIANDNISLTIPNGEVVGFLGGNGAGKTTLIKSICNLIRPTSGQISFLGKNIHSNPDFVRRKVGVMLEGARNLYNFLTVDANLSYFSLLNKLDHKKAIIEQDRLLELFGLIKERKSTVNQLSRGMQQKVAIIVAILKDPDLLILDEPTLGLDVVAQADLKALLLDIIKKRNKTLVICTHDTSLINDVCKNIAVFNKGKLLEYGALDTLRNKSSASNYSIILKNSEDNFLRLTERYSGFGIESHGETLEIIVDSLESIFTEIEFSDILKVEKRSKTIEQYLVQLTGGNNE